MNYQENGIHFGQLSFRHTRAFSRIAARPTLISIVPCFAADRQAVEDFIVNIYAKSYGAQIGVHYPILMSVRNEEGKILAAVGFRYAAHENLFLEQYLDTPVENILHTPRSHITEIGNLASAGGGASMFLFAALSAYLHTKGQQYGVITGTDFLEKRLRTLGLSPRRLAPADPSLLTEQHEQWGTYYDTNPHVLAGNIGESYHHLQNVLGAHYSGNRPRLLPRLHYRDAQ